MPTDNKKILVVGGAGYIGSHMVLSLKAAGFLPVIFDKAMLSPELKKTLGAEIITGDLADKTALANLFSHHQFLAVMHFASLITVAESMQYPLRYYQNNVTGTLNLLECMIKHHVTRFIFSSSAAVYGEPCYLPIDEAHPLQPINPYGRSKLMVEEIIKDCAQQAHFSYVILRYFNAAGAHPWGNLTECHQPESHLIPLLLQVAKGVKEAIHIYGCNYPTADGTCVRDYIHVADLCEAHLQALAYLLKNTTSLCCNIATGVGFSVKQVIDAVERITQRKINALNAEKRSGDPAILIASPLLAKRMLNWQANYRDLSPIIQHAWRAYLKWGHV